MKKTIILLACAFYISAQLTAQWNDSGSVLTTKDNVGIGTDFQDSDFKLVVANGINIGGIKNGSLKVRHINGKDYKSASLDHLYLNYNIAKNVYIGKYEGEKTSNLIVSGGMTVDKDVNIGGNTNATLRVRHLNGKDYKSANLDHLYLNYNIDKNVYIGKYEGEKTSNLIVSGGMTVDKDVNIGGNTNATLRVRHLNGKDSKSANLDHLYLNYNIDKNVYIGKYEGEKTSNLIVSGGMTVDKDVNIGGNTNAKLRVRHLNGKDYKSANLDHLYLNYNIDKNVYIGKYEGEKTSNLIVSGGMTVDKDVNIGGNTNAKLRVRHLNGKDYKSANLDHLYLNYNTGKDVYVGKFGDKASNLFVNGKIGLGTTSTGSHKLAVEGSIGAREIVVESGGWSDFVFDNTYELKNLSEVESFINKNKHLPDVPSEQEVKEKGVNLGQMDAILLQKIEELTLYLIGQNKTQKELMNTIQSQQTEIKNLKKEISSLKK